MATIKIEDIQPEAGIAREEMKGILGGKLRIGQPKDPYEREADCVANATLRLRLW